MHLTSAKKHIGLWYRALRLIVASVPGLTALWLALLCVQGFLPGVTVYLTKLTIDSFVAARDSGGFGGLQGTASWFALAGISLALAEVLRYVSEWVRNAQAEHLSDHLKNLSHVRSTEVDLEVFESSVFHDLVEQAGGESQSKPLALLANLGSVIQNGITLSMFGALLFAYGWLVPVLLVFGGIPSLYLTLMHDRRYFNWWANTASERRRLFYYDGMLSHAEPAAEVRLFDLGGWFREKYQSLRTKLRSEKLHNLRIQFSAKTVANLLALLTAGIALSWIGTRVYNDLATLGDLAVFYQVFSRGQSLIGGLFGSLGTALGISVYLERLFNFLDLPAKIVSPSNPLPFPSRIEHGIRFNNVTFRYPGSSTDAVSNFDLFVPARRKVAVVGVNGAGKSTLIKLLCRFYDPQEGSIEIDGTDIRNFDLKELRRNLSVLFQFPVRFQNSARENITIGDIHGSRDAAAAVAASINAGADAFISKLPDKYDTQLGRWFENGSELSGGEWQKVALARAYFKDAQVLVLDEPTSFMDSWGEADWFNKFQKLSEERTALIITHRFTIAMRADVIHVLTDARLIESGAHHELLEKDGFYASSWQDQMRVVDSKRSGAEGMMS